MKVYRRYHKKETMKAGRYYIGDLCYILDEKDWQEVCSLTFPFDTDYHKDVANVEIGGKFTLKIG